MIEFKAETMKSQTDKFSDYLVSCEAVLSLRFPCRGLNAIVVYFSHTAHVSSYPQQENEVAIFLSAQEYKNAIIKIAA